MKRFVKILKILIISLVALISISLLLTLFAVISLSLMDKPEYNVCLPYLYKVLLPDPKSDPH